MQLLVEASPLMTPLETPLHSILRQRGYRPSSPPTQQGRHYRRSHQPQQVLIPPLLSILRQRGHWSSSPPAQRENTTADATRHRRVHRQIHHSVAPPSGQLPNKRPPPVSPGHICRVDSDTLSMKPVTLHAASAAMFFRGQKEDPDREPSFLSWHPDGIVSPDQTVAAVLQHRPRPCGCCCCCCCLRSGPPVGTLYRDQRGGSTLPVRRRFC